MNLFRIKTEKNRADNLFVHNMDDCGAKVKLSIRFINIYTNIFPYILLGAQKTNF